MDAAPDIATERFHLLVARLAAEMGHRRGWQSVAARRLGIHRSTMHRLMVGERAVTATLIERFCARIGVEYSWFNESSDSVTNRQTVDGHPDESSARADAEAEIAALRAVATLDRDAWLRVRTWADARLHMTP